jgi:hypothetical protein
VPRRYQPAGRNVALLCHLLDCIAFVGRLDGAEPDGLMRDPEDVEGRQRRRFWLAWHAGKYWPVTMYAQHRATERR